MLGRVQGVTTTCMLSVEYKSVVLYIKSDT